MTQVLNEWWVPLLTLPNQHEQEMVKGWLEHYGASGVLFPLHPDTGMHVRFRGPFTAEESVQLVWDVILSVSPRLLVDNELH